MGSKPPQVKESHDEPEITVLRLADTFAHEEDIPALTRKLTQRMKRENIQRDPIIVDKDTGIILDGVHRKTALERIGCDKTVACLVRYSDSSIKLKSWFPCLRGQFVKQVIEKLEMRNIGNRGGKWPKNSISVVTKDGIFSVDKGRQDTISIFKAIEELRSHFVRAGCETIYETEKRAFVLLALGAVDAVIPVPRLKKTAVIEAARTGQIFAPKTTRHIIPKRPLDVRVPLAVLRPETPMEFAKNKVKAILSRRKKILGRTANSNSRPYEESVYVFK